MWVGMHVTSLTVWTADIVKRKNVMYSHVFFIELDASSPGICHMLSEISLALEVLQQRSALNCRKGC